MRLELWALELSSEKIFACVHNFLHRRRRRRWWWSEPSLEESSELELDDELELELELLEEELLLLLPPPSPPLGAARSWDRGAVGSQACWGRRVAWLRGLGLHE